MFAETQSTAFAFSSLLRNGNIGVLITGKTIKLTATMEEISKLWSVKLEFYTKFILKD